MNIGKAIKYLRKENGMTQIQLSKRARVTQTSISQIESGHKRPGEKTLEKIANATKTPVGMIYILALEESDCAASGKYEDYHIVIRLLLMLNSGQQ